MAKAKPEVGEEKMNKRKMVQYSMDELGSDTSPKILQAHIQSKYGTTITAQMLSSYKSNIIKKGGGSGRGRPSGGGEGSVSLKDIHAIRELIDRHGASQLATLVKVLSK